MDRHNHRVFSCQDTSVKHLPILTGHIIQILWVLVEEELCLESVDALNARLLKVFDVINQNIS